jgi:hypothetical protein
VFFVRDAEIDEKMAFENLNTIVILSGGGPPALLYDFNKKSVVI